MHYTETQFYKREFTAVIDVIADFERQCAELMTIKAKHRTQDQQRQLTSLRSALKTRKEWYTCLVTGDVSYFTAYQRAMLLAQVDATTWSPEEARTLSSPRAQHEGKGEKALCMRLGLPFVASQKRRDFPDGECKWLDGGSGKVQTMQVSACGQEAWSAFVWDNLEAGLFKGLDAVTRAAMRKGAMPGGLIDALPDAVFDVLYGAMCPLKVLKDYGNIYCAFEFGYLVVPASDVTSAWRLVGITKSSPQYALNATYIVDRLMASSPDKQADVAA